LGLIPPVSPFEEIDNLDDLPFKASLKYESKAFESAGGHMI
jgi:hypothetical protein